MIYLDHNYTATDLYSYYISSGYTVVYAYLDEPHAKINEPACVQNKSIMVSYWVIPLSVPKILDRVCRLPERPEQKPSTYG